MANGVDSSVKRKYRHTKHTKDKSHVEHEPKAPQQITRRKDIRRWMTPLWILSGVAFALAAILCGISVSHHKFHALWATYVGIILAFAAIFVWWHATIAERDTQTAHPPIPLDKPAPPALSEPKPSASRSVSPLPTQAPATPIPSTPERRIDSLSLQEVRHKLSEAVSAPGTKKYDDVRNALKGLRVDWTLNFFSANRDSSGESMQVWLHDRQEIAGLVVVDLPLAGNEKFPLMEETDVFRVRGIIEDPRASAISLRDATLEYIRSDPK